MAKKLDWYAGEAKELIEEYRKLRDDQAELDRLMRLDWQLPKGLAALEWMRPVRITAPYDAIRAGVRVLSVLAESIEIDPITVDKNRDSDDAKKKANMWEDTLRWQLELAGRRRTILKEDITRSALAYDEICGLVIHLPTQIKSIKALGGDAKRQTEALKQGQFACALKNPQTVFTRYSEYGAEVVLHAAVMRPKAIVDLWGGVADKLRGLVDKDQAAPYYVLFDRYGRESRVVWCIPGENIKQASGGGNDGVMEILRMDHELPFLPWVCVVGGTNLDSKPENQRFPLLWGAMKAEQEAVANIVGSLTVSDAIATFAQPKLVKEGPQPDSIKVDYTDPGGEVEVPPGHKVSQLTQQPTNPALREAYDRFIADLAKSTIPQVLVTAEAGPGEPFSGYNLRIQQAVASLMPWKKLSERWLEGALRQMLLWSEESKVAISGPGDYEINPADIDPEHIYLSVELTPYEPLDEQQKINSAVMASRDVKGLPATEILRMMNYTNPQRMINAWMKEQFTWAELQGQLQLIATEASGAIEQMAAQMAQGMVQQQLEAMQQGPTAQQQPTPGQPMGMPGIGGEGFNPAMGGQPPAGASPMGNIFEQQTGTTRMGEELV